MKTVGHNLCSVLVVLSILLTALGGWMDYMNYPRLFGISRDHAWNDAQYLLLLAIFIKLA